MCSAVKYAISISFSVLRSECLILVNIIDNYLLAIEK